MSRQLFKKHFEERNAIKCNIESFDNLILWRVQQIVDELETAVPAVMPPDAESVEFKFGKITVGRPMIIEADGVERPLYPNEARIRDLTYSAPVFLEITLYINGKERDHAEVEIFDLPILLKSKLCYLNNLKPNELIDFGEDPYDPGDYFIINGTERTLILLEDLAPNTLFTEEVGGGAVITHKTGVYSASRKYKCPVAIERHKEGMLYATFSGLSLPLFTLLRALGQLKDKEIIGSIDCPEADEDMYINLIETNDIKTIADGQEAIAKELKLLQDPEQKQRRIDYMLDNILLPHIGETKIERLKKAYFLCRMARRVFLLKAGKIEEDHRDHYMNKRVRMCGDLLEDLLRTNLKAFVNDILYVFQRGVRRGVILPIPSMIQKKFLTQRIYSAMATGSWTRDQQGVSQRLERENSLATLAHLMRVSSLLKTSQENFEAREIHPTQFGRICPIDTPEGKNVGLRKHLTMLANVTSELKQTEVEKNMKSILDMGVKLLE